MCFIKCIIVLMFFSFFQTVLAEDFYRLLGVEKNCSRDEIKKAFRKKAMKLHPDHTNGDRKKEELFKKVLEAYETLYDPEKRKDYDSGSRTGTRTRTEPQQKRRESFYRVSEKIVKELAQYSGKSGDKSRDESVDELIEIALRIMNRHVQPILSEAEKSGDTDLATYVSNIFSDIWARTGAWNLFSGGDLDVTEAVFKASFLWIKKLRILSASTYDHCFNYGYDYIRNDVSSSGSFLVERAERNQSVLDFASEFKYRDWRPGSERAAAKPRVIKIVPKWNAAKQCYEALFDGVPIEVRVSLGSVRFEQ